MEDLYALLECQADATAEELKQAYRRMAKKYHPDKLADGDTGQTSSEMFLKISHAWSILGEPDLRKYYDAKWKSQETYQVFPVQEDVELSRFDFDADSQCYFYECRCGSCYELFPEDIKVRAKFVCCDNCSLMVQVIYDGTEDGKSRAAV